MDNIELIINYDVPHEGEDYIHRIGRTARAESDGIAITLISPQEQYKFARIERLLEKEVTKSSLPPEFGETPEYNPSKNRNTEGRYRGKSSYGKGGTKGKDGDRGKGGSKKRRSGYGKGNSGGQYRGKTRQG